MKYDTALNEVVKEDGSLPEAIKFPEKHVVSGVVEAVPEVGQSRLELVGVDVSRIVAVETAETILPVRHVLPKGSEILEIYLPLILPIKHT